MVAAAGHNHRPTGPALTGRLAVGALAAVLLATVAWTCGQALSRPLPPLFDGVDHTTADADSPDGASLTVKEVGLDLAAAPGHPPGAVAAHGRRRGGRRGPRRDRTRHRHR